MIIYLKSISIGVICTLILGSISWLLIINTQDANQLKPIYPTLIFIFSIVTGSIVASLFLHKHQLVIGLIIGCLFSAIIIFIYTKATYSYGNYKYAIYLTIIMFGSVFGVAGGLITKHKIAGLCLLVILLGATILSNSTQFRLESPAGRVFDDSKSQFTYPDENVMKMIEEEFIKEAIEFEILNEGAKSFIVFHANEKKIVDEIKSRVLLNIRKEYDLICDKSFSEIEKTSRVLDKVGEKYEIQEGLNQNNEYCVKLFNENKNKE